MTFQLRYVMMWGSKRRFHLYLVFGVSHLQNRLHTTRVNCAQLSLDLFLWELLEQAKICVIADKARASVSWMGHCKWASFLSSYLTLIRMSKLICNNNTISFWRTTEQIEMSHCGNSSSFLDGFAWEKRYHALDSYPTMGSWLWPMGKIVQDMVIY